MTYITSELDRFYDLNLNCATHRAYVENPQGMTCPHHHEDYEIYFLISGNRKYFISNTIYTLQPNQVVIFKPNIPHQVTVNLNVPYERQLVYVTPQLFSEIIDNNPSLKSIFDFQLFNLSDSNFAKALDIISEINKEFERNDEYSQCIIKNLIPSPSDCCEFFTQEHTDLTTCDLDYLYLNFLETSLRIKYKDYLQSLYWQLFRENVLKKYNYTCSLCNSCEDVDVYHINKKLGRETEEDVLVCCNKCWSQPVEK